MNTSFKDFTGSELMIRHCLTEGNGTQRIIYEIGSVRRMVSYFDWMRRTIKRIAKSKQQPLLFDTFGPHLSSDARDLWHVLRNIDEAPKELCKGRRLGPWLKVGLHLANKWEPRLREFTNPSGMLDMRLAYPRGAMTHIFKVIRRACRSQRFRDSINSNNKKAKDNYVSCCLYLLDWFRVHARPLFLRIDLYFEGDAKVFSESIEAQKAYNKFLRNLSAGKIVPDVLGYIGKRENGLERRIHFHVLVFLDGNLHRETYSLTEELGCYWVDECVGSQVFGSYTNCFERKDEYEYSCLGPLHYSDEVKLKGLRRAVKYLCKEDAHILVGKDMGRNIRKGHSPKSPVDAKRSGAPRKHGNDLSIAERILLGSE